MLLHGLRQLRRYHAPGDGVDGRSPHRLVEARLRHPAHALAAVDDDAGGRRRFHPGIDQRTVGDVRVVSPVLFHGTGRPARPGRRLQESCRHRDTCRRHQADSRRPVSAQQPLRRSPGRRRGTGAGGIAAAQLLLSHGNIVLQFCHARPPFAQEKAPSPYQGGRLRLVEMPASPPRSAVGSGHIRVIWLTPVGADSRGKTAPDFHRTSPVPRHKPRNVAVWIVAFGL